MSEFWVGKRKWGKREKREERERGTPREKKKPTKVEAKEVRHTATKRAETDQVSNTRVACPYLRREREDAG